MCQIFGPAGPLRCQSFGRAGPPLCQILQKKVVTRVKVGRRMCQISVRAAARVKVPAAAGPLCRKRRRSCQSFGTGRAPVSICQILDGVGAPVCQSFRTLCSPPPLANFQQMGKINKILVGSYGRSTILGGPSYGEGFIVARRVRSLSGPQRAVVVAAGGGASSPAAFSPRHGRGRGDGPGGEVAEGPFHCH